MAKAAAVACNGKACPKPEEGRAPGYAKKPQAMSMIIAGLGAVRDNRPGYRRLGMAVASRRGWCRYRADILDIAKAPRTSTVNSSPEATVIIGGARALTKPNGSTRGSVTPAQSKPMRSQHPRSPPTARATAARLR